MDGPIPEDEFIVLLKEMEEQVFFANNVVSSLYPSPESEKSSKQQLLAHIDLLVRYETLNELYIQFAKSNPRKDYGGAIDYIQGNIKSLRRGVESILEGKDVLTKRKKVANNIESHLMSSIPLKLDSLETELKEIKATGFYDGVAKDVFGFHKKMVETRQAIEQYCQFFHHKQGYDAMLKHGERMMHIAKDFEEYVFGSVVTKNATKNP